MGKFHHPSFDRLDPAKRESILAIATEEFADKGFHGTSINGLAKKAGVPIGSLYSYFPSKEDLYLTVVDVGLGLLERAIGDLDPGRPLVETFETLLRRAMDYALESPNFQRIYLDATTHGLRDLAKRLSTDLESVVLSLYHNAIPAAVQRGEVRQDLELGAMAMVLDNLIVMFQFSFASDYHRDRLRLFLGLADDEPVDYESLIQSMVAFVRKALQPDPQRSS